MEPGNPAALAVALDRVLNDATRARARGERAAFRALALYDVSQMARRHIETYEELLGGPLFPLTDLSARSSSERHDATQCDQQTLARERSQ